MRAYQSTDIVDSASGFTLIEMLAVLAVLGILATVLPRLGNSGAGLQVRTTAETLASNLRLLHDEAIRRHEVTSLAIAGGSLVTAPANRVLPLPAGVSATLQPDQPSLLLETTERLGFFPDGSSSGGVIALQRGRVTVLVVVRWLDGSVAVRG